MYQIQYVISMAILMAVLVMANTPVPESIFNSKFQPIEAAQAAAPRQRIPLWAKIICV